ncbi:MAG TPA: NAD-binding protein [Candidatus Limnocylindrales bacterium]|nr:NAD-binding protein [Candidatus Limnocylindrales bacterium]
MFILVVGAGKVGYYLAKELIENGHEVVVMEKDRARADQIADELGSIVVPHDGCEGKYLGEAGCSRADIVAAVTGDDASRVRARFAGAANRCGRSTRRRAGRGRRRRDASNAGHAARQDAGGLTCSCS